MNSFPHQSFKLDFVLQGEVSTRCKHAICLPVHFSDAFTKEIMGY